VTGTLKLPNALGPSMAGTGWKATGIILIVLLFVGISRAHKAAASPPRAPQW